MSNEVVATIPTGVRPADVAAGAGHIWVANLADDTVTQIDPRRRGGREHDLARLHRGGPGGWTTGGVWIGDANRARGWCASIPAFARSVQSVRLAPGPESSRAARARTWWQAAMARCGSEARTARSRGSTPSTREVESDLGGQRPERDRDRCRQRVGGRRGRQHRHPDRSGERQRRYRHDPGRAGARPRSPQAARARVGRQHAGRHGRAASTPAPPPSPTRSRWGAVRPAWRSGEGAVWVANSLGGTVSRIDPREGRVEATVEVGRGPAGCCGRVRARLGERPAEGDTGGHRRPGHPEDVARLLVLADPGPTDPALDLRLPAPQRHLRAALQLPRSPVPGGREAASRRLRQGSQRCPPTGARTTFRVRPGFRFSPPSNEPVTAEAFERAIERGLEPEERVVCGRAPPRHRGRRCLRGRTGRRIAGVSGRGDRLVIRLERPSPDLTARLAARYFCAVPPSTPITPKGVDAVPTAGPYYVAVAHPEAKPRAAPQPELRRAAAARARGDPLHDRRPARTAAVAAVEAGRADYVVLQRGRR